MSPHPDRATPRLEVDVTHTVGTFTLQARFSLGGGLTVLFGPSGAGKSVTLRLAAGIDRPTSGHIAIDNRTVADPDTWVPARDRRIGMVFQDALLLPHRSVISNVALGVRSGTRRERTVRASDLLDRVGAGELADRRPGDLSGGQRQRVALARALAGDPRILLLDEPFSALDVPVRRRLRSLVAELVATEGIPALFVTHDTAEAETLADSVLLALHGYITRLEPGPAGRALLVNPPDRESDR